MKKLKYNEDKEKKSSYESNSIFECLDGCEKCSGSYFSTTNPICKCDCHKDKNSVRLISYNERVPGPEAFAEMYWEYIKNGNDPDVF